MEFTYNDLERILKTRGRFESMLKRSKDRPYRVKGTDFYTSAFVNFGNKKLDDRIAYNSISPGKTCLCGLCPGCYAAKDCKRYPSTDCKYAIDSFVAVNETDTYMDSMYRSIDMAVASDSIDAFRFHESGDFFSQDYLDKWVDLASCFPHLRFYGYTGVMSYLDFSKFKALENVNLINSYLPDGKRNFDVKEVIIPRAEKYRIHVCKYVSGSGLKCGFKDGQCKACIFSEYVAFIKR